MSRPTSHGDNLPRQFYGARLREVREDRMLSRKELAARLGVDPRSVSAYERDQRNPPADTILRAAQILQAPLAEFYLPPETSPAKRLPVFFRSLSRATKAARARAAARISALGRLERVIEDHLELPPVNLPDLGVPEDPGMLSSEDIEDLAGSLRRAWGLGDGPISNVVRLLEGKGILVARFSLRAGTLDGLSRPGNIHERPKVLLNSDKGACVRSRFDAAHELAHLVLHSRVEPETAGSPVDSKDLERQADRFASAFLLPATSFAQDVRVARLETFLKLKLVWKSSVASQIMRAGQLGLVGERRSSQLWRNLSRRGWRTKEPLDDELDPEVPDLLRNSIELLLSEQLETRDSLLARVAMSGSVAEELVGLSEGRLSRDSRVRLRPGRGVIRFPAG